jgi:hypothetical protein
MTDTMTSQNIDLSSWDTLYTYTYLCLKVTAYSVYLYCPAH